MFSTALKTVLNNICQRLPHGSWPRPHCLVSGWKLHPPTTSTLQFIDSGQRAEMRDVSLPPLVKSIVAPGLAHIHLSSSFSAALKSCCVRLLTNWQHNWLETNKPSLFVYCCGQSASPPLPFSSHLFTYILTHLLCEVLCNYSMWVLECSCFGLHSWIGNKSEANWGKFSSSNLCVSLSHLTCCVHDPT